MDRLIVERKLDSLQRCIRRIRDKRPDSVEALAADVDLQDVLVLNLSRAVQVCVDLAAHLIAGLSLAPPNTMGEAFDRLVQGELLDAALAVRMKKPSDFAILRCMPTTRSIGRSPSPLPPAICRTSRISRASSCGGWTGIRRPDS